MNSMHFFRQSALCRTNLMIALLRTVDILSCEDYIERKVGIMKMLSEPEYKIAKRRLIILTVHFPIIDSICVTFSLKPDHPTEFQSCNGNRRITFSHRCIEQRQDTLFRPSTVDCLSCSGACTSSPRRRYHYNRITCHFIKVPRERRTDAAAVRLAKILAVLTYWVLQYFQRISGLYIVETLFAIVFHRSSSITHSGSITLSSYEPHTLLGNSRNGQPR